TSHPLIGSSGSHLAECRESSARWCPLNACGADDPRAHLWCPTPERCVHPYVHTGDTTHVAAKIRLKRIGKIRTPHYRIVVMDARQKRDGKAIEEIGLYHPKNDPSVIKVNSERAQYWLGVGAQPTEAVIALFKRTGDWQTFTGDSSPSGVDVAPEKADKLELFNAALAEID